MPDIDIKRTMLDETISLSYYAFADTLKGGYIRINLHNWLTGGQSEMTLLEDY